MRTPAAQQVRSRLAAAKCQVRRTQPIPSARSSIGAFCARAPEQSIRSSRRRPPLSNRNFPAAGIHYPRGLNSPIFTTGTDLNPLDQPGSARPDGSPAKLCLVRANAGVSSVFAVDCALKPRRWRRFGGHNRASRAMSFTPVAEEKRFVLTRAGRKVLACCRRRRPRGAL